MRTWLVYPMWWIILLMGTVSQIWLVLDCSLYLIMRALLNVDELFSG